jgi:hypothetical protein
MTPWGKVAPESDYIQVQSHNHRSIKVPTHKCKISAEPNGNKKKEKTIKPKKKTGKHTHFSYPKVQDDCKESVLQFQEIKNLLNNIK